MCSYNLLILFIYLFILSSRTDLQNWNKSAYLLCVN